MTGGGGGGQGCVAERWNYYTTAKIEGGRRGGRANGSLLLLRTCFLRVNIELNMNHKLLTAIKDDGVYDFNEGVIMVRT